MPEQDATLAAYNDAGNAALIAELNSKIEAAKTGTVTNQDYSDFCIKESKSLRVELDATLQKLKTASRKSRERSIAITKLQEAVMWLGMDLKELNAPNPYPNSYNPANAIVEPTADGLKL